MGHGAAYRGFAVPPESAWRLEIPSRSPSEPSEFESEAKLIVAAHLVMYTRAYHHLPLRSIPVLTS